MQQAIAILDSGVGGLTVVKEVVRQLPQENIIYFGDTDRTPYGPRDPQEVVQFTHQIVDFLLQFQPKMVVIACNTATAVALDEIRTRLTIPVVGVIHPGARAAIRTTRSGVIGVIGTEGTIRSNAYEQALRQMAPQTRVFSEACPQFAPLVEKGQFYTEQTRAIVYQSLQGLKNRPMDCLILGCTHYPFLADAISDVMGPEVTLISSAEETAREISAVLDHQGMLAGTDSTPVRQFFCSGDPVMFKQIAQSWLNEQITVTPVVWPIPHII
ncbi:glutamate racemase [Paenibacillus konkukensis]|uniref:glutamate racemase n=1 Tax=Paenibacillus konkukensis TaxID=2020716 RepID=UPI00201DF796|nr:glutamate racemase [Paenibacillus konkukensis]